MLHHVRCLPCATRLRPVDEGCDILSICFIPSGVSARMFQLPNIAMTIVVCESRSPVLMVSRSGLSMRLTSTKCSPCDGNLGQSRLEDLLTYPLSESNLQNGHVRAFSKGVPYYRSAKTWQTADSDYATSNGADINGMRQTSTW